MKRKYEIFQSPPQIHIYEKIIVLKKMIQKQQQHHYEVFEYATIC